MLHLQPIKKGKEGERKEKRNGRREKKNESRIEEERLLGPLTVYRKVKKEIRKWKG